ncbi:hypothetical protein Acr_11g0007550 [Actinidia rufa]|uniref:Uncharacterized protein n=1 Tax=Actinidia rufa TaxID=165716 RepID=A0A7J0FE38_9ERIC|nr:hypothetical protein Acr_11g0007550 [Actinidia rufa]
MSPIKLAFSAADLLHVYTMVRPRKKLGTPFLKGNHYLCLRNPRHPQTRFQRAFQVQSEDCKVVIQVVNNRQASRKVANLLAYESVYQHVIPHKAKELGRIRLPTLHNEGQAPHRSDFSLECSGTELNEEVPLAQVILAEPIDISSSDNEHSNNLAYNPIQLAREVEIAHSFREGGDSNASSGLANMTFRFRTLGHKKSMPAANPPIIVALPIIQRKGKHLVGVPRRQRRRSARRALAYSPLPAFKPSYESLTFPQLSSARKMRMTQQRKVQRRSDFLVTQQVQRLQRATAISNCMKQQLTELKKTKKKVDSLESELNKAKLTLDSIDQLKAYLTATEKARDASYMTVTQTQNEAAIVGAQRDKALQDLAKLQVVACGPVYEWVFNRGINRPAEEGGEEALADEGVEPVGEVVAEEVGEDAAQDQAKEVEAQDPPPSFTVFLLYLLCTNLWRTLF